MEFNKDRLNWVGIWLMALNPDQRTYHKIVSAYAQNVIPAIVWIGMSGLLSYIFIAARQLLLNNTYYRDYTFIAITCTPLVVMTAFEIQLLLFSTLSYGLAKLMGGRGYIQVQIFVFAAFMSPLNVLPSIVDLIAYFLQIPLGLTPLLWIPFGVYQTILSIIATKSVHQLNWRKAILASVPIVVLNVMTFVGNIIISSRFLN